MKMILPTLAAALLTAGPAGAQMSHDHHDMSSMPPAEEAADPHAGHRMPVPQGAEDQHSGHANSAATPIGTPPPIPTDHPADRYFDPADMERSRAMLRYESGGMPAWMIMIDQLEYRARKGANGYAWEGEGWYGGDTHRLVVKSEGEGGDSGVEEAEVQALYSRPIGRYTDLQLGLRHDIDFVERKNRRYLRRADFRQHRINDMDLLLVERIREIHEVDQQIGAAHLLKGALEGFHQSMRNLVDEPDGVHQHHLVAVGQTERAGGGVQRGEKLVLDEHPGPGQCIHQGRFARVGVTHQGNACERHFVALFAL